MSKSDTILRRFSKGRKGLWWLPLVTAVLGFLCAALFNSIRTPLYETTTTVEVVGPHLNYELPSAIVLNRDHVRMAQFHDEVAPRWDLTIQNPLAYDEVVRRLDLTEGSEELAGAVSVNIPGYNPQMVNLVTFSRQQLPHQFANRLPRPPLPPPNMEIRVRHNDPLIASEIGQTLVDVANDSHRSQIEQFVITGITLDAERLHATLTQLTITRNSEAEQAILLKELDMLMELRSHSLELLRSPAVMSPPLLVVTSPSLPSSPIHTRSNLALGASAGALLGLIMLLTIRGKRNEL
jgi:hypothetical protein